MGLRQEKKNTCLGIPVFCLQRGPKELVRAGLLQAALETGVCNSTFLKEFEVTWKPVPGSWLDVGFPEQGLGRRRTQGEFHAWQDLGPRFMTLVLSKLFVGPLGSAPSPLWFPLPPFLSGTSAPEPLATA